MLLADKLSEFKSFADMLTALPTDEVCRDYYEILRWNGMPTCTKCGCMKHYRLTTKGEFKGWYKCKECKARYNVSLGTMFEGSHVGYRKWFIAIYIFQAHKKGVSAMQLSRDIGVSYRTAWFMEHRIRNSMFEDCNEPLDGNICLDEAYCGGRNKNRHRNKKFNYSEDRKFADKIPILGIMQQKEAYTVERQSKTNSNAVVHETIVTRPAKVRCFVVPDVMKTTLLPIIRNQIKEGSTITTDEWSAYKNLRDTYFHHVVEHRLEHYVDEEGFSSNAIEGFWTWLKRGYMGIYHKMTRKYMQAYADEFAFRYNFHRLKDRERFDITLQHTVGRRITYKQLVGK